MTDPSFVSRLFTTELRPALLPRSLAAGTLIFLIELIVILSFSALIFSGPLAAFLPFGIGMLVVGDVLLCGIIALFSSYAGSVAVEQDVPVAVLAVAVAALVANLPATATPAEQFSTAVSMIVGTTLLTGLFFTLLGALKLGKLVRFLPYPVMGGFLAGTGYLLTLGGLGVMLPAGPGLAMLEPEQLLHWAPGIALGGSMFVATARLKNPLVLPVLFALGLVVFYVVAGLTNTTPAQLYAGYWLLGPFPAGSQWEFPLRPELVREVNWHALANQWQQLATIPLVSVVALLLNASGIELNIKRDMDLNRELVVAGVGNLLGGMAGGTAGYHTLSLSNLSHSATGGKRLPGILVAVMMGAIAVVGPSLFGYVPRMVVAALLVFLGLELLVEWLYRAWFRFPRIDFLILVAIVVVIALRGYLEGVGIGLVLTIILFLISYSGISVARYAVSGKTYRSRVLRNPGEQEILDAHGDELYVFKLQGFIFFGTADSLVEQIRDRTREPSLSPLRFVVLDLAHVSGLDSTALLSFAKLLRLAREQAVTLVMAGLPPQTREQFSRGDLSAEPDVLQFFADLDHAVEWCENRMIGTYQTDRQSESTLRDALERILPDRAGVQKLIGSMERVEVAPGEYLMQRGEPADALYFIESGELTAQLEAQGKEPVRLETMRSGRTVGEIGFYLEIPRTAAVVAGEHSVVYRLSRTRLAQIEGTDPEAAYALHRIIVYLLGERVRHLTGVVDALER